MATSLHRSESRFEPRAESLATARRRGLYERWLKTPLDLIAGLLLTVILLPISLILAAYVLIRIGRPILYREDRVGKNGRIFRMNRFRTTSRAAFCRAAAGYASGASMSFRKPGTSSWVR